MDDDTVSWHLKVRHPWPYQIRVTFYVSELLCKLELKQKLIVKVLVSLLYFFFPFWESNKVRESWTSTAARGCQKRGFALSEEHGNKHPPCTPFPTKPTRAVAHFSPHCLSDMKCKYLFLHDSESKSAKTENPS